MLIKRPMLAEAVPNESIKDLPFPMIAMPKIDGIRCLQDKKTSLSRSFKPIPNHFIQKELEGLPTDLDGELIVQGCFNDVQSQIMSQKGEPDFTYWVFDYVKESLTKPYKDRLIDLANCVLNLNHPRLKLVPIELIKTYEDLVKYENQVITEGYEGVILRTVDSPYKCGRSTLKQAWMLKIKRFVDAEAKIIGFEEMMYNENELTEDKLGYAKRSLAKDGKVPANTLGKFLVQDIKTGVKFACGTGKGLTHNLRQYIWDNQDLYIGLLIKYKYQPHGTKEAPRLPIWLGFRDQKDM